MESSSENKILHKKFKLKLFTLIPMLVIAITSVIVGVFALQTTSVNLNGSVSFEATSVYATVTGSVSGAETNPSLSTLNFTADNPNTPSNAELSSWTNNVITFQKTAQNIVYTITVTNNSLERALTCNIVDVFGPSPNLTTTVSASSFVVAADSSQTITITLSITDKTQEISNAEFSYVVLLSDASFDGKIVTFNSNGGHCSTLSKNLSASATTYGELPTPTRSGCTFTGWYTSADGGTQVTSASSAPSGNTTLFAHWTVTTFTVNFLNRDGTTFATQNVIYGHSATAPSTNPTSTGYTFTGWASYTNITSNRNVVSNWTQNTGTIKLGTLTNVTSVQYKIGESGSWTNLTSVGFTAYSNTNYYFKSTIPTETGYTITFSAYSGWFNDTTATSSAHSFTANGGTYIINATATKTANQYTITYALDGGTNALGNPTSYTFSSSEQVLTVNYPTKTSYNFTGWTISWTDGTHSSSLPTISTTALTIPINCYGNITLTVNTWSFKTYTVNFLNYNGTVFDSQTVNYGNDATAPATNPTRTGYTFVNWSDYTNITSNRDITPTWNANTYTISYALNGGTNGNNNPVSYTFSESAQNKIFNDPSKTNCTFTGWTVSWTDSTHSGSLPTFSGTTLSFLASCYGNITLTANLVSIPLTFSSSNTFTLSTYNSTKNWNGTLEYSTDAINWTTWNGASPISSSLTGTTKVLYLRGTSNTIITGEEDKQFVLTGSNISCTGNIENLLDYSTVNAGNHPTMGDGCFAYLFLNCTSLTTAPALPATTLANYCYQSMFYGCTSLTTAPALPATTLANYCYAHMFYGCTSLTTAPALPATTLAASCYSNMFYGCTSLTTAPALPATTLADDCYQYMFNSCTSLSTAPALPATTLAIDCYRYMFSNCTNLTTAPALPATTLSDYCYQSMFYGCASLTTAPALPATTLAASCYRRMFSGCTNLTTLPELPATTLAYCCYEYMFSGCTALKLYTTSQTGYTNAWTFTANSSYCSSMFKNCYIDGVVDTTGTPTTGTKTYYVANVPRS